MMKCLIFFCRSSSIIGAILIISGRVPSIIAIFKIYLFGNYSPLRISPFCNLFSAETFVLAKPDQAIQTHLSYFDSENSCHLLLKN